MKVEKGTQVKSLFEIKGGPHNEFLIGSPGLPQGAILTIDELGFFGFGVHLAVDAYGNAWAVDEDMIDSENPDLNNFTIHKETNA